MTHKVLAGYEIRFQDHLDPCWHTWFEGWTMTNLENGVVCLQSTGVDQSALHGALNKIRDLNLLLISVARIVTEEAQQREGLQNESARTVAEKPGPA
jgi:hypothetical protein